MAQMEEMESPVLTRFWGRSDQAAGVGHPASGLRRASAGALSDGLLDAWLWRRPDSGLVTGMRLYDRMKEGKMPPMIWVMLDECCAQGTHEFADSANDGPWGAALTTEFMP